MFFRTWKQGAFASMDRTHMRAVKRNGVFLRSISEVHNGLRWSTVLSSISSEGPIRIMIATQPDPQTCCPAVPQQRARPQPPLHSCSTATAAAVRSLHTASKPSAIFLRHATVLVESGFRSTIVACRIVFIRVLQRVHSWFWVFPATSGQKPAGMVVRTEICPCERTSRDWGDEQD